MDVQTRDLEVGDWGELWPMLRSMGCSGTQAVVRERFVSLRADQRWQLIGAVVDGRLAGYAALQDYGPHLRGGDTHRTARLHDMFVSEELRHRGVGRALMTAAVEWAGNHVVHLEWQAHCERSAPFYQRLGYVGDPCPQPDYPQFEITFDLNR